MKESIAIKNLGPIKDLTIPEIKPMTVLIGKSSIGKSAVMKAIAMMRYLFKRENIKSYLKNSNIKKSPIRTNLRSISKLGSLLNSDTEITYTVTVNQSEYRLTCKNLKIEATPKTISKDDIYFIKGAYISESRSFIPSMLEKIVSNRNIKIGFYEEETLKDFDEATNTETRYLNFMDMLLRVKKTPMRLKSFVIEDKKKGKSFLLKDASSGIRNSVPVEAIMQYFAGDNFSFKEAFNRSVLSYLLDAEQLDSFHPIKNLNDLHKIMQIHVEEPEISLDPESQTGIIQDLVSITFHKHCKDREFSAMLTTHSPYILNFLNVLMEKFNNDNNCADGINPEKIAVYLIKDGRAENLVVNDEGLNNRKVIDTNWFSDSMEEIYNHYENLVLSNTAGTE